MGRYIHICKSNMCVYGYTYTCIYACNMFASIYIDVSLYKDVYVLPVFKPKFKH